MRYGELVYANGSLNGWTSVAGQIKGPGVGGSCSPDIAWQLDQYTLNGNVNGEDWVPDFTWHGFQYIEVGLVLMLWLHHILVKGRSCTVIVSYCFII